MRKLGFAVAFILCLSILIFPIGCGRKSQVLEVVFEGNWDGGEFKTCEEFERIPHYKTLLCGSLSAETRGALTGNDAVMDESIAVAEGKPIGTNEKDHLKKIREDAQDHFFSKHAHEYPVLFAGTARPIPDIPGEDGKPWILWDCQKSDRGLACDPLRNPSR